MLLQKGADYGWPECYFDRLQNKLVLAPEYGGDGKEVGVCAGKRAGRGLSRPLGAERSCDLCRHAFPAGYQGGAFIAFHGSWNRAPEPQGGYNVVFQPLADGKAAGPFIVFADGFAGAVKEPGRAAFRPSGLAMGPDGALYISDDKHGRIWRVTYHGAADAALAPAPAPKVAGVTSGEPGPPEGTHPDAGRTALASLPVPAGATKEQVALGDRIFHGEAADGTCTGCHGSDANGSPQATIAGQRQVAANATAVRGTSPHHHRRRAAAEELSKSDAAPRRRAADRLRCRGRRRLCLGDQPPEREIMAGVNSSPEHDLENRVPLFRIML